MSVPRTPTGRRLLYHGVSVEPPRMVSRVTPSMDELVAIEDEAAAMERERLRAHTPDPRLGTDYIDCRCGWQAPRPGLFVWWTAHVLADPEPQP